MSNQTNTLLLEEAHFYADYFEGKQPAKLIYKYIEANDYDNLAVAVKKARDLAFELEYNPNERVTSDTY